MKRSDLMRELNSRLGTNFNWSRLCKLDLERLVLGLREKDDVLHKSEELMTSFDVQDLVFEAAEMEKIVDSLKELYIKKALEE